MAMNLDTLRLFEDAILRLKIGSILAPQVLLLADINDVHHHVKRKFTSLRRLILELEIPQADWKGLRSLLDI
jgi:hypothetical protein